MLVPAKTKYRKSRKGGKKILGAARGGTALNFGSYKHAQLLPPLKNRAKSL
jgi:ribosomal protein L16/L10AE